MRSIRSKILTIVIFALLASTLTTGMIGFYLTNHIMHRNANTILDSAGKEAALQVNEIFGDVERSVELVSTYAVSELGSQTDLYSASFWSSYLPKVESLFTNISLSTKGVVAYYFRPNPSLTSSSAGFFISRDIKTGQFRHIPPTDLSIYDPDDTEHVGWYYEPIRAGKPVWMMPYYNKNNHVHMISYVVPLYQAQTFVGVIGMDVEYSLLTNAVDDITIYENGFAYLTDKDGQIVYAPTELEERNEKELRKYMEATASLRNGLTLVTRADYNDVQTHSRLLLAGILISTLVLILVFGSITVASMNRIVNPLRKLTKMAEKLADNNEVHMEIVCDSKDEVGTLSRIFKETSDKLREYMSYINALAYRDSLTGVKNRAAYAETVAELEKQMNLGRPTFGVLVADINNLKMTNDTYGHDVGNRLIVHASRLLGGTFRHSPLFRIGGDEFVVIFSGNDYENYRQLLRQLDHSCATDYIEVEGKKISLSIAHGVACYDYEIDTTYNEVFQKADHAMYMHKQSTKSTKE